ncbi:MAG: hypothetical protein JNM34_11905 [Chthonomonadaceae bacterium]|nr:hypothetical protein [Chthonomonadaceae bacterium]
MKDFFVHLSRPQRLTLGIAVLLAFAMFVLPPVGQPTTYNRIESPTYGFLFNITSGLVLDYVRLMTQYGLLAIATLVLIALLQKRG